MKKQAETGDLKNGTASGTGAVSTPGVCIKFSFPNSTGPAGSPQAGDPVKVVASANYNWLGFLALNVRGSVRRSRSQAVPR